MRVPKKQGNVALAIALIVNTCKSMQDLKRIHAFALVSGLLRNPVLLGKIFRFAAVSPAGDLRYAHHLFDQITHPRPFFYNTLIRGYSKSPTPAVSFHLFNQMRLNRADPDDFTLTFLLKSRARMRQLWLRGCTMDEIHGVAVKLGLASRVYVSNALIHLYGARGVPGAARRVFSEMGGDVDVVSRSGLLDAYVRAGEVDEARSVFDAIPEKDVVAWTAMISGYSRAKRPREALELFWQMLGAGEKPDEVTMLSVVSACASLGDLGAGVEAHKYIDGAGFGWMVSLCNALIDMYSKCGCLERAVKVFENAKSKDAITWNSMILAFANHGLIDSAFGVFWQMTGLRIAPDKCTFLALLVALSRKGLVDEGYRLFESMERDYGVGASVEHYGCMIDMLGKNGRLQEAYDLLKKMPMPRDVTMWESFIVACRHHGDEFMAKKAGRQLRELKADGVFNLLLQETYFADGPMRSSRYD